MRKRERGDQEKRESVGPVGQSRRLAAPASRGLDLRLIEGTEITRCQSQPHDRSVRPQGDGLERGIDAARQDRLTMIEKRLVCLSIGDGMTWSASPMATA